jgi:hypothetical protein
MGCEDGQSTLKSPPQLDQPAGQHDFFWAVEVAGFAGTPRNGADRDFPSVTSQLSPILENLVAGPLKMHC